MRNIPNSRSLHGIMEMEKFNAKGVEFATETPGKANVTTSRSKILEVHEFAIQIKLRDETTNCSECSTFLQSNYMELMEKHHEVTLKHQEWQLELNWNSYEFELTLLMSQKSKMYKLANFMELRVTNCLFCTNNFSNVELNIATC